MGTPFAVHVLQVILIIQALMDCSAIRKLVVRKHLFALSRVTFSNLSPAAIEDCKVSLFESVYFNR